MKQKSTNLVKMRADTYQATSLSQKKEVTGVPSVLYVNPAGEVSEVEDIRNGPMMQSLVKTGSPVAPPQLPVTPLTPAPSFRPLSSTPAPSITPKPPATPKPLSLPPPATPIAGTRVSENPLEPVPALPVRQWGGSPWAAFLAAAARQAAPAAALLGAYAALPKRSSGLPAASRRHRHSSRRLRRTRRHRHRSHQ